MTGEDLKKRKKRLHLTTADLALLAGLPIGTVSKVMTGETKNPSYITIEKIDAALCKQEQELRLKTYQKCMQRYFENAHIDVDDEVAKAEFEKRYRERYNLDDRPIEYARPRRNPDDEDYLVDVNLALSKHQWTDVSVLDTYGDELVVEMIDGEVITYQHPGLIHQRIVGNLGWEIRSFISNRNGNCEVFASGLNVFPDGDDQTLVIPDVVVVCDDSLLMDKGVWGAPDWVIEIISPSTKANDYGLKMRKYMQAGVREYWVINPEDQTVVVYINSKPIATTIYGFSDVIPVGIYDGQLTICVGELTGEK